MIKSMTGYGKASGDYAGKMITVEIRSLNSKFLELGLRLPASYKSKELELRSELGKIIERGKVDVLITFDNSAALVSGMINKEVIRAYYDDLKTLKNELQLSTDDYLATIMRLPLVINTDSSNPEKEEWDFVISLVNTACKEFDSFRKKEGKVLEADVNGRVAAIESLLLEVEKYEPARIDHIRNRISSSIDEIRENTSIDPNRFEQELIYYIEKIDISEEKVRLRSHCNYFKEVVQSNEGNGKKLGFISQELGREINTIGSKANDANMQKQVVNMKDELEKLKEQLANVL